jgi:hypothetical protein
MLNPNKPTTTPDHDATRGSPQDVEQPSLIDLVMAISSSEEQPEVPLLMRTTCIEPQQHCRSTRNHHTSSSTLAQLLQVIDAALILVAEDDCVP